MTILEKLMAGIVGFLMLLLILFWTGNVIGFVLELTTG